MSEKIQIPELDIEVEDVEEFSSEASQILEDFCIDLSKKDGMCRPADLNIDSFFRRNLLYPYLDEWCV